MPPGARVVTPLSKTDIQRLLQQIFNSAPADLAIEAFAVTAAALYGWCDPDDIDAALAMISLPFVPIPTSIHDVRRQSYAVN